jgi:hypothetical protein
MFRRFAMYNRYLLALTVGGGIGVAIAGSGTAALVVFVIGGSLYALTYIHWLRWGRYLDSVSTVIERHNASVEATFGEAWDIDLDSPDTIGFEYEPESFVALAELYDGTAGALAMIRPLKFLSHQHEDLVDAMKSLRDGFNESKRPLDRERYIEPHTELIAATDELYLLHPAAS